MNLRVVRVLFALASVTLLVGCVGDGSGGDDATGATLSSATDTATGGTDTTGSATTAPDTSTSAPDTDAPSDTGATTDATTAADTSQPPDVTSPGDVTAPPDATVPTDTSAMDTAQPDAADMSAEMLCADACNALVTCPTMTGACSQPLYDEASCRQQCLADPGAFSAEIIVSLDCESLTQQLLDQVCGTDPQVDAICDCGAPPDLNLGAACTADTECLGGPGLMPFCVAPPEFPGGYCAVTGCSSSASCGADGECLQIDEMGGTACFDGCAQASECRSGYQCLDLVGDGSVGICYPQCTSDAECPFGGCDPNTGQCQ